MDNGKTSFAGKNQSALLRTKCLWKEATSSLHEKPMCKYTGSVLVNGIEWQLSAEYFCCKYKIILDSFKYPYSWPKYLRIKTFLTSNWVLLTRNKPKLDLHGVLPYTEIIIPDLGGQATVLDNFGITQTNKFTQVLGENNLNLPLLINGVEFQLQIKGGHWRCDCCAHVPYLFHVLLT